MIKIIGVTTSEGLPVTFKTFIKIQDVNTFVSGLVGAITALSQLLGAGEVKQIAFETDKLLVTASKKGYLVVALVSSAEDYVQALLRSIAKDIDDDPSIEESIGIVDSDLENKMLEIINYYVEDRLDVTFMDILMNLWEPIERKIEAEPRYKAMIDDFVNAIEASRDTMNKYWLELMKSAKGDLKKAIEYALSGDFNHACAIAMNCCKDDPLGLLFIVKTGLLSHEQYGVPTPGISQLWSLMIMRPSDDPIYKLLEYRLRYFKDLVSLTDYIELFKKTIPQLKLEESDAGIIKALVFVDNELRLVPEFAKTLENYFRPKSEVIAEMIRSILERTEILNKAYSFTKLDDIRDYLSSYESNLEKALKKLDSILKPGLLKKIFGLTPRGAELNKLLIKYALDVEAYIVLLALISQSPAIMPRDKVDILNRLIKIYESHIRPIMKRKYPVLLSTILSSFQAVSIALGELYPYVVQPQKIIERIQVILDDIRSLMAEEFPKMKVGLHLLSTALSSISPIGYTAKAFLENELSILYTIIRYSDAKTIESWKRVIPYNFAAFTVNLSASMGFLAARMLEGEERLKVVTNSVDFIWLINKWLLVHGKFGKIAPLLLSHLLSIVAEELDKKTLKKYLEGVTRALRIGIPDFKKFDYEVAIVSEHVLRLLAIAISKGLSEYRPLFDEIYKIAKEAWERHGFQEKAKSLEKLVAELKTRFE